MDHIEPSGDTGLQVSGDAVEHLVWLTNNHMIGKNEQGLRLTAGIRSPDHRASSEPPGALESVDHIGLLDMHPAYHDQVSPQNVSIEHLVKGSVDEPDGPMLRRQSGHR